MTPYDPECEHCRVDGAASRRRYMAAVGTMIALSVIAIATLFAGCPA